MELLTMKTQQGVLLGKCSPFTADLTLEYGFDLSPRSAIRLASFRKPALL